MFPENKYSGLDPNHGVVREQQDQAGIEGRELDEKHSRSGEHRPDGGSITPMHHRKVSPYDPRFSHSTQNSPLNLAQHPSQIASCSSGEMSVVRRSYLVDCVDQLIAEISPNGKAFSRVGTNILVGEWREKLLNVCQGLIDDPEFAKEVLKKSLILLRSDNPEKQKEVLPVTIKNFLMPFSESWLARNFQGEFNAITTALSDCMFFDDLNACIVYSKHPDTHQYHPALSLSLQGAGWSSPVNLTYFIENALGGHEQGFRHSMLFDLEILCFMKQWEHRHSGFHVDIRTSLNLREYSKSILEIILTNNTNRSLWTESLDFSRFFQVDCNGPELCIDDLLFRLGEIHQQLAHNESGHRTGDDVTEYKSFKKLYLAEKEKQLSGNTTKFEAL